MDYLQELYEWFGEFWESLVNFVQDVFYWIINALIKLFGEIFTWAVGLLPTYVLPTPQLDWQNWPITSAIAYFFPVHFAALIVGAVSASYVIFFTVGTVLRWLRVSR